MGVYAPPGLYNAATIHIRGQTHRGAPHGCIGPPWAIQCYDDRHTRTATPGRTAWWSMPPGLYNATTIDIRGQQHLAGRHGGLCPLAYIQCYDDRHARRAKPGGPALWYMPPRRYKVLPRWTDKACNPWRDGMGLYGPPRLETAAP